KDILEISLAHLAEETEKFDTLKENIINRVSELPLSINTVAKHSTFIKQIQSNHYWSLINDEAMDKLAEIIAPLMKFKEKKSAINSQVQLNLQDVLKTKEMVEFGPQNEAVSITKYRELVESRIAELTASNPILQKLKAGDTISESEAETLAAELHEDDPHITINLLRKVYKHQKANFIQFIKHILGIEILKSIEEEVSTAVQQFISEHTYLTTRQIEFL